MQTKKVAILGTGKYGRFWKDFLEKRGCEVKSSDIGTTPNNEQLVMWAEVVIIAVSLMETVKVIRSLLDLLRPEQIIIDLASTKVLSTDMMLSSDSEVLGLHPFCAPPTKRGTFSGQTIFVYHARVSAWREWVRDFLAATEGRIEEIDPKQHDQERTVDQVLEHACTHIKESVKRRMGLNTARLFEIASPVYKLSLAQTARMYAQSAHLYGALAMTNPFVEQALNLFQTEFFYYRGQVAGGDIMGYTDAFEANRAHIGAEVVHELFEFSEQLNGLMADLVAPNSLRVITALDGPGILEKVGAFFREAGINLTAVHSRRVKETVEFFVAFEADKNSPCILKIRERLVRELAATVS